MAEVKYLEREQLFALNRQAVVGLGGTAGIQSPRAFEVVLEQPKQVVFGQEVYPTIWVKAAYMMQQIVKTPVFVDGSKRTAGLVVLRFLQENGYQPVGDDYNDRAKAFIFEMVQEDNSEETMMLIAEWLSAQFASVENN
jgi:death-on-curing protein